MLKPLQQWYCDVCGEIIEKPSDGYVIWKRGADLKSSDFKIIHQGKCDLNSHIASSALSDFLGQDGMAYLTSFLSHGPVRVRLSGPSSCEIKDMDEFTDFFRRLQLPYYEEARRRFSAPKVLERLSDWNEIAPYFPDEMKKTIES
ncbi:MAG: hypothetical protein PHC98_05350 [Syntrophotalea acetylenica]|nr:hypothetical protein [Syntrophotalea acetylenica]